MSPTTSNLAKIESDLNVVITALRSKPYRSEELSVEEITELLAGLSHLYTLRFKYAEDKIAYTYRATKPPQVSEVFSKNNVILSLLTELLDTALDTDFEQLSYRAIGNYLSAWVVRFKEAYKEYMLAYKALPAV